MYLRIHDDQSNAMHGWVLDESLLHLWRSRGGLSMSGLPEGRSDQHAPRTSASSGANSAGTSAGRPAPSALREDPSEEATAAARAAAVAAFPQEARELGLSNGAPVRCPRANFNKTLTSTSSLLPYCILDYKCSEPRSRVWMLSGACRYMFQRVQG